MKEWGSTCSCKTNIWHLKAHLHPNGHGYIVFLAIWLVARIFLRARKLSRKFKTNRRSHVASIYFAKLPQSTASIYKSLGFYERHLLPQNVGIIWCSPCESFNNIESEKSVYVRISKRKQAISAEDSNSYLDCFSLQIAFSLSCKVTVILKAPPSHYRGWSEGK